MLTHSVTGALDLDDNGVVQQSVEQRSGDYGIAEDLAPFGEAAIGGEDHGALFVAGVDQLEEQVGAARCDRQVTDLIDDQQRCAGKKPDLLPERAFALGFGELGDEIGQRDEVDRLAGADCLDRGRVAMWLLPVPGGPSRWTTSARSMKSRPASARMRFLSSEGWNEKS